MGTKYSDTKSGWNHKSFHERISVIKKLPKNEREGYFGGREGTSGTRSSVRTRATKGFSELNPHQKKSLQRFF